MEVSKYKNFSFTEMYLKILSAKWQPLCPGGDELICYNYAKLGQLQQADDTGSISAYCGICLPGTHYSDVIMGAMASQISSLKIVHLSVYSGTDQRKHQSSASLASVPRIQQWPVNSPHKWPVTRKMFPFDNIIMSIRVVYIMGACIANTSIQGMDY